MDCRHCYELGIREGYESGFDDARRGGASRAPAEGDRRSDDEISSAVEFIKKEKRKPTAANKKYAKAFKKLAPSHKKKNGSWKKNGFKNCCKASHKMCKK